MAAISPLQWTTWGLAAGVRDPAWAARLLVIALLGTTSALLAGCSRDAAGAGDKPPPNVVLIVLDTLRVDHLGCYGYDRPTSPQIDAFARGATRYLRSFSTAPWTLPSHASMFTGKYPFEHGAHTIKTDTPRAHNARPLDLRHLTLAEALRSVGYETAAFVCNEGYLGRWTQVDQGFDTYFVKFMLAARMNERIFEWLQQRDPIRPFFLFVNLMDTHRPYNSTPRPGLLDPPPSGNPGKLLTQLAEAVLPGDGPVPQDLRQRVIDHYDTAVANVDEQVGRLLDELKRLGLLDASLVIVTSDHGEYFGEHHLVEHSKDVYQPALHVPLLIKRPGQQAASATDAITTSATLPNLILREMPLRIAQQYLPAFADAPGNHLPIVENYYSRPKDIFGKPWSWRFRRVRTATYQWPYKYIRSSDGQNELYNLEADPDEATNLVDRAPEVAGRMADRLEEFQSARKRYTPPTEATVEMSQEELRRMEALGYLGEEEEAGNEAESPE